MVKTLCRLNQRYYWLLNFLLEQISSHISFIVTFGEPFLFPDIVLYTIGTIVTRLQNNSLPAIHSWQFTPIQFTPVQFTPRRFTLDNWLPKNSLLRQFTPKAIHSLDSSLPGQFTPETIHSQDNSLPRQFTPETIHSRDNSLPNNSLWRQFTPETFIFWGKIYPSEDKMKWAPFCTVTGLHFFRKQWHHDLFSSWDAILPRNEKTGMLEINL